MIRSQAKLLILLAVVAASQCAGKIYNSQRMAWEADGRIEVLVVDDAGQPFPTIPVVLMGSELSDVLREQVTGPDGTVSFAGLPGSLTYLVAVRPEVGLNIEASVELSPAGQSFQRLRLMGLRADVPPIARDPLPHEVKLCEAVFRHFARGLSGGFSERGNTFYLNLLGKDPSPDFLERFVRDEAQVRKGSTFKIGRGRYSLSIDWVHQLSEDEVEIGAHYYAGLVAGAGLTFKGTRRQGGDWIVAVAREHWRS